MTGRAWSSRLALLASILDRVPCFELTFVPDPSVVGFVRDHA